MKTFAILAIVLGLGFASLCEAHMSGKWDCARGDLPCWEGSYTQPGCGESSCHGTLVEGTNPQLMIQGLPMNSGYAPGTTYDIQLWVIGAPIYATALVGQNGCSFQGLPVQAFSNLAGFNLELAAGTNANPLPTGTLASMPNDATTQIRNETQCYQFRRITGCDYDVPGAACPTPPACDDTTIVSSQATHTYPEGTNQLMWNLQWTAPNPGAGPVAFHLGGIVVNGNCRPDLGDRWALSEFTVNQAP